MKERIHWIDVAKGLMIIGMVINHIPNYCNRLDVDISSFPWFLTFGNAYGVFTMQSFFILSGYTTNFNQEFKTFFLKQVKGLLIPYLAFTLICSTIAYFTWGESLFVDCFGERWSFLVESYWFLTALFVAKVLMYFISRLSKKKIVELGGGILLLVLGIAVSEYYSEMPEPSHWHNWFHYRNGLCMAVFLPVGYYLNKYKVVERYGLWIGILYCVVYCITFLMTLLEIPNSSYLAAPSYTHYLVPNLAEVNGFLLIPSYLFYTIAGSVMVFWLSQKIVKNGTLEFFGKTSLTIYCVHFTFLMLFVMTLSPLIPHENFIGAGCLFFAIAITTLASSALVAWLFEKRPLKYMIGKF